MKEFLLFTDVSLDPGFRVGFGAGLVLPGSFLDIRGSAESIARNAFRHQQIRFSRSGIFLCSVESKTC